ncbi:MAG TPA: DUF6518 family protein [Thermoleophilaceae bacterium]|jgi:hypothetical protein|nr:DUF6518 family protein [Thermoleophilaceae bacterium]
MQGADVLRAIVFGAVLALVTRYCRHLPGDFDWLQRVGVPWLGVAFAAGIGIRRERQGAALGSLALATATLVYYADALLHGVYGYSPLGIGWLAVAVPGGAVFGALGAAWSNGRLRIAIAALMSACFAGEALLFARFADPVAAPYLMATAALLPVVMLRGSRARLRAVALSVPLVAATVVAEASVFVATGYLIRA